MKNSGVFQMLTGAPGRIMKAPELCISCSHVESTLRSPGKQGPREELWRGRRAAGSKRLYAVVLVAWLQLWAAASDGHRASLEGGYLMSTAAQPCFVEEQAEFCRASGNLCCAHLSMQDVANLVAACSACALMAALRPAHGDLQQGEAGNISPSRVAWLTTG